MRSPWCAWCVRVLPRVDAVGVGTGAGLLDLRGTRSRWTLGGLRLLKALSYRGRFVRNPCAGSQSGQRRHQCCSALNQLWLVEPTGPSDVVLVGLEFRLVDVLIKALEVLVEQPGFNLVYGIEAIFQGHYARDGLAQDGHKNDPVVVRQAAPSSS